MVTSVISNMDDICDKGDIVIYNISCELCNKYTFEDIINVYDKISAEYNSERSTNMHRTICRQILWYYFRMPPSELIIEQAIKLIEHIISGYSTLCIESLFYKYPNWSTINKDVYIIESKIILHILKYLDTINIDYSRSYGDVTIWILECPQLDLLEYLVSKFCNKHIENYLNRFCIAYLYFQDVYNIIDAYNYLVNNGVSFKNSIESIIANLHRYGVNFETIKYIIDDNFNELSADNNPEKSDLQVFQYMLDIGINLKKITNIYAKTHM